MAKYLSAWTVRDGKPGRVHDVALTLGVEPSVIYDLVKAGKVGRHTLPGIRAGWVVGVDPAEVRKQLEVAS